MLCIAAACLLPLHSIRAEVSEEVFDIPRLDKITIDGNSADWGGAGYHVELLQNIFGMTMPPENFNPMFRMGWTEEGLNVLFQVTDDVYKEDPSDLAFGDSVKVTLVTGMGADQAGLSLSVAPGLDRRHPKLTTTFTPHGKLAKPLNALVAKSASRATPRGYDVEMLLPWSNLNLTPESKMQVFCQVSAMDVDVDDGRQLDGRFGLAWHREVWGGDPFPLYRVRLSDHASPAVKAVVEFTDDVKSLPWVRVRGLAEFVGQPITLKRNGKVIEAGVMEEEKGWSFGGVLIPKLPDNQEYSGFQVFIGDELLASKTLKARPNPDTLFIMARPAPEDARKTVAQVSLDEFGAPGLGAEAEIDIIRSDGKSLGKASLPLSSTTTIAVAEGIHLVRAKVKDLKGYRLHAEKRCFFGSDHWKTAQDVIAKARKAEADPGKAAYAGWLNYLSTRIEEEVAMEDGLTTPTRDLTIQLSEWLDKIEKDPDTLGKLRGTHEWAFLSKVDGTGQPFTIEIPANYDPKTASDLTLGLKGADGTHRPLFPLEVRQFKVTPLARGPRCGYSGLAEVDLFEVLDYVQAHWNIDPKRIYVSGGSMGGGGTFQTAARYPDRFAAAMALCGYGTHVPVKNLVPVPMWSLHSQDDWVVPVSMSRMLIQRLSDLGGEAIQEEANGFGHAIPQFQAGMDRMARWGASQRLRPAGRHIYYSALDEQARKAWWVEVAEWGPEARPATIDARLADNNDLHLSLDNVKTAKINLAASSADRAATMTVVIEGTVVDTLRAPLSENLFVNRNENGWSLSASAPKTPSERLHFPGGAMALYHGEPLMIVWGTRGSDDMTSRLLNVARSARKSFKPYWPELVKEPQRQWMVSAAQILYGQLPGKADVDVTDADMQKYNLVLIGTAEQNAVVAQLADRLPVKIEKDRVVSSDGESWNFSNRALGLLHYNPQVPQRLIYWAASNSPEFYQPGTTLMNIQSDGYAAPDMLITAAKQRQVVAARCFDSRWQWEKGYADSPLVSQSACSEKGSADAWAGAISRETGANFALLQADWKSTLTAYSAGETRYMDQAACNYYAPLNVMDLTGRQVREASKTLAEEAKKRSQNPTNEGGPVSRFLPESQANDLEDNRLYRIAMPFWGMWDYVHVTHTNPESLRITDHTLREALLHHLPDRNEPSLLAMGVK